MREAYLDLWVSIDDRLALQIERAESDARNAEDYPYRVTVFDQATGKTIEKALCAEWHPRTVGAECETDGKRRLDRLVVELGTPAVGQTYTLYFGHRNFKSNAFGGLNWAPALEHFRSEDIQCLPELGPSYTEALLTMYDDVVSAEYVMSAWTEPYANFRLANDAERALHAARTSTPSAS